MRKRRFRTGMPYAPGVPVRGLRVVGPGCYVWDADPREALGMATDLGVRRPHSPLSARRRAPVRSPLRD